MNNEELQKEWDKAKQEVKIAEKRFSGVLSARHEMSEKDFGSYCEEMQYALEHEEHLWKKAEGRLY